MRVYLWNFMIICAVLLSKSWVQFIAAFVDSSNFERHRRLTPPKSFPGALTLTEMPLIKCQRFLKINSYLSKQLLNILPIRHDDECKWRKSIVQWPDTKDWKRLEKTREVKLPSWKDAQKTAKDRACLLQSFCSTRQWIKIIHWLLEHKTSKRQARVKDREKTRKDWVTSRKDKQKTVRLFLSFLDFCQWDPSLIDLLVKFSLC